MAKPVILAAEDAPQVLRVVGRNLRWCAATTGSPRRVREVGF